MVDQATGVKLGATPGKLVLVAVLAVILMGLVVSPQSSDSSSVVPRRAAKKVVAAEVTRPVSTAQQTKTPPQRNPSPRAPTTPPTPPPGSAGLSDRWTLQVALQHDPFSVPPALQPKRVSPATPSPSEPEANEPAAAAAATLAVQRRQLAARKQAMTVLAQQRVSMVFRKGTVWMAVIGDKLYQAGDLIDSFRIVEIGPDGVTIEDSTIH